MVLSMLLAKEAINTSAEFKVTYKYLMCVLIPIYYRLLITNIIKYIYIILLNSIKQHHLIIAKLMHGAARRERITSKLYVK